MGPLNNNKSTNTPKTALETALLGPSRVWSCSVRVAVPLVTSRRAILRRRTCTVRVPAGTNVSINTRWSARDSVVCKVKGSPAVQHQQAAPNTSTVHPSRAVCPEGTEAMSSTRSDCVQNEFRVAEHCLDGSPVKPCEGDGIEGSDVQCDTSGAATGAGADKEVGAVAVAELRAQVAAARAELVAERRRSDEAQLKSQGEVAELREQLSERNAVVAALVKERNRQDRRCVRIDFR